MGSKKAKEMRNLVLSVSASVLILLLAIIAYFIVDVTITTNNNIERNRELVIEQSLMTLSSVLDQIKGMSTNAKLFTLINPKVITDIASDNMEPVYTFIVDFVLNLYPVDYVGVVSNGKLVASGASAGLDVDSSEMAVEPKEDEYDILHALGGEEGFFISQFYEIDLKMLEFEPFSVNLIVDRTDEMADVTNYFEEQRNGMILRLSIAAGVSVILSLLLTTFGLRFFTRKYVVKPIEELNRAAEEIADGTFEGEVQTDPESAYYALQGLLRSGQKVLRHMDQEMKE